MRLHLPILALAAVLLAAAFAPGERAVPDAQAAKPLRVSLSIAFQKHSDAPLRHATLVCKGSKATASGWLANRPKRACQVARRQAKHILEGPESYAGSSCLAQIYGPQRARLYGTLGSRSFDRRVSRNDSCAERDYQVVARLLPKG